MLTNNYRSGDIVSLRSGGPHMTVSDIQGNSVMCQFYNPVAGEYRKETFFFSMLRTASSTPMNPEGVSR